MPMVVASYSFQHAKYKNAFNFLFCDARQHDRQVIIFVLHASFQFYINKYVRKRESSDINPSFDATITNRDCHVFSCGFTFLREGSMWFIYYVTDFNSNGVQLKIQTRTNGANNAFIKSRKLKEKRLTLRNEREGEEKKQVAHMIASSTIGETQTIQCHRPKKPTQNQLTKWKIKCIEYTIKL